MALIRNTPADDSTCGWFHLSPPRVARPPHSGTRTARWAVVGAGFTGLAAARQLALNFPDDEIVLIEAMSQHPTLINRPIVRTAKGTALCRPPETVLGLID